MTTPTLPPEVARLVDDLYAMTDCSVEAAYRRNALLDALARLSASSEPIDRRANEVIDARWYATTTQPVSASAPSAQEATAAARDVLAERERQISGEGWTPEHDDEHDDGALAQAAAAYAKQAAGFDAAGTWPWRRTEWKPTDPRQMLVKAGALILAEIERLDRKESK